MSFLKQLARRISIVGLLTATYVATTQAASVQSAPAHVREMFGNIPLNFEANFGQVDGQVKFLSRGPFYNVFLTQDEVVLTFGSPRSREQSGSSASTLTPRPIHIKFTGANKGSEMEGKDLLLGHVNYFRGNDPAKWRTDVPTYGQVRYSSIYPGTDLVFYGTGKKLEYDFVLKAGADPSAIKLALEGADYVRIDKTGDLLLTVGSDEIRLKAPTLYQEGIRGRQPVAGFYALRTEHSEEGRASAIVSFELGAYDHSEPLVIDPVLDYSTYLGGSNQDYATAVAINSAGEAYVTGGTNSLDFPTTAGAVFPNHAPCTGGYCYDAFITKFNVAGDALVYSTYLGGSNDDGGTAIAVDSTGAAYVTGSTQSTDFPTTAGAFQRSCGGTCFYSDAFVTKLDPTGSVLAYSTYLGGSNQDNGTAISVQGENAYVSGFSASTDFPTTPGAYQRQLQGQASSFVVQVNANGTALNFGTFLGEVDLFVAASAIAVEPSGNSYIAGVTVSSNFPLTPSAFRTPFQQGLASNLYITKLNPTGSALVYSALLGGVGGSSIAIDTVGSAYVSGNAGTFYPITPGALNPVCDNGTLAAKLSPDGSQLQSSALVCNEPWDTSTISRDMAGNILLFGDTTSPSMPTTVGAFQTSIANGCCVTDISIAKLTPDFSALAYETYFGGDNADDARAATTDAAGNLFGAGDTSSTNFPVRHPFQATKVGYTNAFVSKFTLPGNSISVYPAFLNFNPYGLKMSSRSLLVTVANISKSDLPISSIVATGDFSQVNNCGSKVLAGRQCTVSVVFKPSKVGTRSGNLIFKDSAGTQKVVLNGTGVDGPLLSFSPNYQILNQPVGYTSPPLTVVVSNTGNKVLSISQISLQNGPTWNFYGNTNCLNPVKPNGHCSLQVDYTPGFGCFDQDTSDLQFTDNANGSPQYFGLVGQCGPSTLDFSSYGVRFDPVAVGHKSAMRSVAVINGLSSPLTISSIAVSANFIQTNNCPMTLDAGAYCYLKIASTPTHVGIIQGTVTVTDSSNNIYTLPLLGTGTK